MKKPNKFTKPSKAADPSILCGENTPKAPEPLTIEHIINCIRSNLKLMSSSKEKAEIMSYDLSEISYKQAEKLLAQSYGGIEVEIPATTRNAR